MIAKRRGGGGGAGGVLGASRSPRSAARLGREGRSRLTRRPDDAPAAPSTMRAAIRVALLLALTMFGAGGAFAQGFADDRTIHEMAARDDVPGIAKAINAGVPVDVRDREGETALHVAVREVHLFSVMMLIAKGANPNARDAKRRIPLHLAADGDARRAAERFQIVKLLVGKGSDLEAIDADGKRPVDYAKTVEFRQALAPPVTSRKASPRR